MIPAVLPTYTRAPLAFTHGEGSWLVAEDGQRYLDLGSGIAVNALGHAHPALVDAITAQAGRLWHVSNVYRVPEQERLAAMLVDATFADTVFFTNSGTEACELAIKMVRKHWDAAGDPGRVEIVAFGGAFHGRSTGAIAAAGSDKMVRGFGPLMPGFVHLPFGDHDALRAAVTGRTAAVLVEPVQGEGGVRVLPDACLKGLRNLCDATGALMVLDEVQCGMGRTGRLFAHEWAGVSPDIMMVAKGIGGGFPLGCVGGAAVLGIVGDEGFLAEVRRKGALFRQGLEGLVASHPQIFGAVRGVGLILGLECRVPVGEVVKAGYAAHLLTVAASDGVVRLLPALNIPDADIAEALTRLDRAATALEWAAA